MWASSCLNNSGVSQNCINSIILQDFSAAASHTWSAKAYATINEVKTEIDSWDAGGTEYSEGDTYNVWAKKVISYGGHYYELDDAQFATNAVTFSTTMGDADAAHEFTYTLNDDIAYYTEGEAWDNKSQITNSLVASAGQYVNFYSGTKDVSITDAGVYVMETNVLSRGSDSGLRVYDSKLTELAGFYRTGTGFKQTARFYTAASSTIKVGMSSANTAGIDYVLIRKVNEASDAIAECKTYETSDAFATYIDGLYATGSLLTAAQVYTAHTTWQAAQADAASSTDYTKVIFNADFGTGSVAPWTIYGDAATGDAISDANANGTIESNGVGGYQYYTGWNGRNVSQNVYGLPAGVYRLSAKIYSWSGGAPVRLFANGTLSTAENGENHEPTLDFVVTGNEASVKIGVGGTGNNDDTDNTWGAWGYRIDYFTLTKIASVSTTLDAAGYATFASSYALDVANMTATTGEATAYKAAVDGTQVNFSPLDQTIPANTGILLKGTAGATVTIPVVASGTTVADNEFLVNTSGTTFDAASGYYYFAMMKDESTLTFATFEPSTLEFPAGKAYLKVPVSNFSGDARLTTVFADDETSGVSTMLTDKYETADQMMYNLSGQRVSKAKKGLYILNGKKMLVD